MSSPDEEDDYLQSRYELAKDSVLKAMLQSSLPCAQPSEAESIAGCSVQVRFASVGSDTDWSALVQQNNWLSTSMLNVTPDQTNLSINARKLMTATNLNLAGAKRWVDKNLNTLVELVGGASGVPVLSHFFLEPVLP